jgi:hypothetical protein
MLTRSFERPGLDWARERIALFIFHDFITPICGILSFSLGLSNLLPLILGWRFSAFGRPVLAVYPEAISQHCLDALLEIRKRLQIQLRCSIIGFTRNANLECPIE